MSGSGFLQRNFILETYFTWKSLRLPRSRERCAGDEAGAEALRHRDVVCFGGGGCKQTVQWQAGSIISPPLNTWRQHVNLGGEPVRFAAITNAPVVVGLFHNLDFVFNNDFYIPRSLRWQSGRFQRRSQQNVRKIPFQAQSEQTKSVHTWLSAFVPDAHAIGLQEVSAVPAIRASSCNWPTTPCRRTFHRSNPAPTRRRIAMDPARTC
jgi:hypothetical protein